MFVRCFCELNVCLDEYELLARPRVAGHYNVSLIEFSNEDKWSLLKIIE